MRTLIWDSGAGEIRAGLLEDGELKDFRIIRLRRDSALLQSGERYTVRITQRLSARKALATIGVGEDGIIAPCDAPEGALLVAEMLRPPIPEPGRWKRAQFRLDPEAAPQSAPAWHFSAEPWELFLREQAPQISAIICRDARAANMVSAIIGESGPEILIDPPAIAEADLESLIEQAVAGEFPISGGALSIERTRAMTVIDVDGIGDALQLNLSAAAEIPRLLRLLDIGGPIAVDFVSMKNRADRLAVDAALEKGSAALGPHERTAINGFGLCQIIRPRTRLNIMEIVCGTGQRQLSAESCAVALLRAVERSEGVGPRQIVARPDIIDLIRQWPQQIDMIRARLGAEIELVGDPGVNRYGHVHVRQN